MLHLIGLFPHYVSFSNFYAKKFLLRKDFDF